MQNVSACVVSCNSKTPLFIHLGMDLILHSEPSEFNLRLVNDHAANRGIGVDDAGHTGWRCECSAVAHLATGFSIERRLIENQFCRLVALDRIHGVAVY